MSFKGIIFHFRGPICSCEKEDIMWNLDSDGDLTLTCDTCRVSVMIPDAQVSVEYQFEIPYPADRPGPESDEVEVDLSLDVYGQLNEGNDV